MDPKSHSSSYLRDKEAEIPRYLGSIGTIQLQLFQFGITVKCNRSTYASAAKPSD